MKITTLNRIRAHSIFKFSWEKLLKGLNKTQADNEPLTFKTILEICGLDNALCATRTAPEYNWRLLAVPYARRVQHLNPDPRVSGCLNVAERYANGQATDEELRKAQDGARIAAGEVWGAAGGAWAAAWAAADTAAIGARCGTWVAMAAWDAALAVHLAAEAVHLNDSWAARVAERKEQEKLFIEFVSK